MYLSIRRRHINGSRSRSSTRLTTLPRGCMYGCPVSFNLVHMLLRNPARERCEVKPKENVRKQQNMSHKQDALEQVEACAAISTEIFFMSYREARGGGAFMRAGDIFSVACIRPFATVVCQPASLAFVLSPHAASDNHQGRATPPKASVLMDGSGGRCGWGRCEWSRLR